MASADLYVGGGGQTHPHMPVPPKGKGSPSVGWFVNDRFFERAKEWGNNSRGERLRHQLSHTCNSRSLPRGFNPDIGGVDAHK